jgi:PKHD-type hydroxylase
VTYPSSTLHEVTEVTRGERLVAVTWAQSYVRDERQREILSHISEIKDLLNAKVPDTHETDLAHQTHANLMRMWAET